LGIEPLLSCTTSFESVEPQCKSRPAIPRRRHCGSVKTFTIVKEIIARSKNEGLDRLLLHALDDGRSVYEQLGFIAGNEMHFAGVS
jgi:hypothetical protein